MPTTRAGLAATLCGAALMSSACTPRDRAPAMYGLSAADITTIATAWHGPAMLDMQQRAWCDTLTVAQPQSACGTPAPMTAPAIASLAQAAATLAARAREARTPALLHALALVDATTSDTDTTALRRAVDGMDEAATRLGRAAPVALQVDRAALHLQRYALTHEVPDLLAGLDAADVATQRDARSLPACWNRALAMTWLGMRHSAPRAWAACAALDARARMPTLVDSGTVRPEAAREVGLDGRWLEATQEYAFKTALPLWGRSVRLQHADSAALALRLLDSTITLMRRQPLDSSLLHLRRDIAAVRGRPTEEQRLARAAELYGGAQLAYLLAGRARAPDAIDSVLHLVRPTQALWRWARLQRASGLITSGHAGDALDTLRLLRRATAAERSLFALRTQYDVAVALVTIGQLRQALPVFDSAATGCLALGLERCSGSSVDFMAQVGDMTGDEATTLRSAATMMGTLARSPATVHHWSGMATLRQLAVVRGHAQAARLLEQESADVAVAIAQPGLSMETVQLRARDHIAAGDTALLARDLAEAQREWLPQLVPGEREWYAPDLLRMEAELLRARDARRSLALVDSALQLLRGDDNAMRRSDLVESRARSALAAGDSATALRDLDTLLQSIAAREGHEPSIYERARLGQVQGSVAQLSAQVLRRQGQVSRAFAALSGRRFSDIASLVPPASGGVQWRALRQVGDSVWTWAPQGDSVRLRVVPLPARVTGAAAQLDRAALATLYDALLRSDSTALRGTALHLDVRGPLAAVPWGAVYDTVRQRYLVELLPVTLGDGRVRTRDAGARVHGDVVLVDAATGTGRAALPGAVGEIDALVALWRERSQRVDARRGAQFTLSQLQGAGTIHFAGHAMLDRQLPERSYLALPSPRDSVIAATQILSRSFRGVRLVVLAGCETRGFPLTDQGGFDSLAGAFLSAGAETVIGAGWRVDDAPTSMLMQAMHAALRAGQAPAAALRAAQVSAIRSSNAALRDPRAWAAFQVMGS